MRPCSKETVSCTARIPFAAVCVVLATISASAAHAGNQEGALDDPLLDALVAEALQHAPEIGAARASVDAAKRRIVPADRQSVF